MKTYILGETVSLLQSDSGAGSGQMEHWCCVVAPGGLGVTTPVEGDAGAAGFLGMHAVERLLPLTVRAGAACHGVGGRRPLL